MPIQINPVDFRGFSLGGGNTPQLPSIGALGLQAIQARMSQEEAARNAAIQQARIRSADEAMLRQNILERQKMGIQQDQFNRSLNLDTKKLGLLSQQNLSENALKQMQFAQQDEQAKLGIGVQLRGQDIQQSIADKNNAQEMMKAQLAQLKDKKEEELQQMGAFAVQAKLALGQAKDPSEANILRNSIVDESVANGYIDKDMGKQLKQMPLSGFNNYLNYATVLTKTASDLKALSPKGESGDITITQPDGTKVQVQGLTKPTQNQLQKQATSLDQELSGLKSLEDKFNAVGKEVLGYKGQAGLALSKEADKLQGVPVLGSLAEGAAGIVTGKNKQEQEKFIQDAQAFENQTFQVFNKYRMRTTGMQAAYAELTKVQQMYLDGKMSYNQYLGSLHSIVNQNKEELEVVKKQLKSGVEVSPTQPKTYKWNPETKKLEPSE